MNAETQKLLIVASSIVISIAMFMIIFAVNASKGEKRPIEVSVILKMDEIEALNGGKKFSDKETQTDLSEMR